MKKILLLIATFLFIFTLTACNSEKEVTCSDGETTITIVYNKDEIIEVLIVDGTTEELFTMDDDAEELESMNEIFQEEYGDDMDEAIELFVEDSESEPGVTCEVK